MAKTMRHHRLVREEDLPDWLQTEIERWRSANPELGVGKTAFGMCHSASDGFVDRVAGTIRRVSEGGSAGLPGIFDGKSLVEVCEVTEDPYFAPYLGESGSWKKRRCDQHHVARVGFWMIDWTARQFRPRDKFPRIWLWQTY